MLSWAIGIKMLPSGMVAPVLVAAGVASPFHVSRHDSFPSFFPDDDPERGFCDVDNDWPMEKVKRGPDGGETGVEENSGFVGLD